MILMAQRFRFNHIIKSDEIKVFYANTFEIRNIISIRMFTNQSVHYLYVEGSGERQKYKTAYIRSQLNVLLVSKNRYMRILQKT